MVRISKENSLERIDLLSDLEEKVSGCGKCPLFDDRKNGILGDGSYKSGLLIVRDFPEFEEDRTGNSWSSPMGRLLEKILNAANIHSSKIYSTYLVHCRPVNNKLVMADIKQCQEHLLNLIEILNPAIIAVCGRSVLRYFLGNNKKMSNTHGKFFDRNINGNDLLIYPLPHPSIMVKFPPKKKEMFMDLNILFKKMKELEINF